MFDLDGSMKRKLWNLALSVCMLSSVFTLPVHAANSDITISTVDPTLFVKEVKGSTEDKPKYRNDVTVSLNNKSEGFNAWAKVVVGKDQPYIVKIDEPIKSGGNKIIIPVTDTKDRLKANETTTLKFELFDNEACTGSAKATYETDKWERTRRWEVYFSQTMHSDIGFTDYQENLKSKFADFLDQAKGFVDTSNKRETDVQKYKYMIESGFDLGESYMKKRNAEQIEEITELVKEQINMSITAGLFNYTTETFNTEELARATYYTNRYLVDSLGIEPSELQNMFDNPSFSKSYVDTAVQAGIKYGFHSMNQAHSPYHKKRQYDLFYMQGNDPKNKMLVYNGYKYSVSFGFDSSVTEANKQVMNVLTGLQNRPKERGTGLNPYPFDKFCFAIVPYGDNAGPRDKDIQIANALNKKWEDEGYAYPRIKVEFQDTFMKDVEKEYGPEGENVIPTETGTEENWWNDGWGTTAYESGINKEAGNLLSSAEKAASLASLTGNSEYPYEELNEAMQRNLTYDEHTWGIYGGAAGSDSYHNQFEWKRSNAFGTKSLSEKILDDSLQALSKQVKTTEDNSIYVYNSLNWNRDDVVTVTDLEKFPSSFEIMDGCTSIPYSIGADGTLTFVAKNVPAMGYKTFTVKTADTTKGTSGTKKLDSNVIENSFYKVTFAPDGTIASILDKQNGNREIVDTQADTKFNQYQYYDDFGVPGGDYSTSIIDKKDRWKLYQPDEYSAKLILEDTPLGKTAKLDTSTFRAGSITQTVTLYDGIPRIDISNEVVKEALPNLSNKEEAYYTFPFKAGEGYKIQYDLPSGNTGEGEQIYGTCTDWYTANKWVNVKDGNYNMALAVPNTSLLMFGERRLGEWSFDYKSDKPYIYSWVMNNFWDTNFQRDQPGYVNFKYSISTNNDANYEKTSRFGWEISNPLQATVIKEKQSDSSGASTGSYVSINQNNVQMSTMKTSESNGEGMIVRFHEIAGKDTKTTVTMPFANIKSVIATDIIENDKENISNSNSFTFDIPAYGFATFRINFNNTISPVTEGSAITGETPVKGTKVSWNKVDGAKYYEIFRSSDENDTMTNGGYLGSTTKLNWFDTQVVQGLSKPYFYKIRAVGNGVKSELSGPIQQSNGVYTDTTAPDMPTLGAQMRSKSQVDLYWTPVFDDVQIHHYEVYRDGTKVKSTTDNYVTTFRDKTVKVNQAYTYTVKAVDTSGNVKESKPVVVSTAYIEGPTLTGLSISNGTLNTNFNSTLSTYQILLGNKLKGVADITITPTTDIEGAEITVNGKAVENGHASQPLKVSEDSVYVIKITKGDKSKAYTLYPTAGLPLIRPLSADAGSTYAEAKSPLNTINNSGMSGKNSLSDTHDAHGSANTMWHTLKNPGENAWISIDLGNVYKLDEMHIWNMNQGTNSGKNPENPERAMKNVKIEYSQTGADGSWVELKPEEGMEFKGSVENYPFQLAPTQGTDGMPASNLNDGNKTPVRFDGKEARYVKISAHPQTGIGNWSTGKNGSEYYGLSEVRFTTLIDRKIDKSDLQNLVTEYRAIDKEAYLDRNWDTFMNALSDAEAVLELENATQNMIDNAELRLRAVFETLVKKPTIKNPIIRPLNATAGSVYNTTNQNPNKVIDGTGMSGKDSLQDTHDNQNSARTMWHTANNPGENAWIQVDLGEIYELDEMWIWNMNQESNMTRGMKNVKIEYSEDNENWKELQPEEGTIFSDAVTEGYPFQFTKASGNETISATNLNDGKNTPVRFNKEKARYVKVTAAPIAGEGSWGDTYFGLSELRFTQKFDIDKTALQELVDLHQNKENIGYTEDSWNLFEEELSNAKSVLEQTDADQNEVDAAYKTLTEAIAGLTLQPEEIKKDVLQKLYDKYKGMEQGSFTDESWEVFVTAMKNAEKVLKDETAKQDAVDWTLRELEKAVSELAEKPVVTDKSRLEEAYKKYEKVKKGSFTDKSWKVFEKAREKAYRVLQKGNASQKEIDEALTALHSAFSGLSNESSDIPVIPEDPLKPIKPNNPVKPSNPQKPKPSDKNKVLQSNDKMVRVTGELADGTTLSVKYISVSTIKDKILDKDYLSKVILEKALDISLLKNGKTIQPSGDVKVTLQLEKELQNKKLGIIYIDDSGRIKTVKSTRKKDSITFTVSHFSTYGIVSFKGDEPQPDSSINQGITDHVDTSDTTNMATLAGLALISIGVAAWILKKRKNKSNI